MARKKRRRRGRKRGFAAWSAGKKIGVVVGCLFLALLVTGTLYAASKIGKLETTTLDAAGLKVGDTVHVKDLEIAKNKDIDLKTDPEAVVLSVIPVHNVVPETEVTTAPAAAAAGRCGR